MTTPATELGTAPSAAVPPAPARADLPHDPMPPPAVRGEEQLWRVVERLTRVVAAQRDIACAPPDAWGIYELAVQAVQEIVRCDGAAAMEVVGEHLVIRAARGDIGPGVGTSLPAATSFAGASLRSARCMVVRDALTDDRGDPALAARMGVRSILLVPLVHEGVPVAALTVTSAEVDAFSIEDADLLMLLADVTSARLAHALALHQRDTARLSLVEGQRLRSTLFDAIGDGIVVQDAAGQIIMANPAAERILGATSAQMQGRTNVDVAWHCVRADGTDLPGEELPASVALRTGLELRGETVGVFTPDGRLSWLSVTAVPMFDGTPREVIGVVVSFTDVTADRAAADALRASEQQFRLAFDNAPIGMLVVSLRPGEVGRTLQVNEAFCRMLGYNAATEAESVLELSQPDWTHEDDRERDALLLRRLAEGDTDRVSFEKRYVNRHGQTVHAWVEGAVAYGPDSEPWYVIVHCLDVTDRKQAQDELRRLALTDSLTGLANRTLLDDRIRLALTRLRRNQGYVALLLIDLDRFKVVNDSLGHELGDSLLVEAARRLLAVTRAGTTVARLGGDEFVVFLDGLATADEAQVVARRLLATLREPYALPGSDEPMVTTASLGIAVTADPRRNAADLLREADLALYRAKDAGRDRSALFDDELKTRVVARLDAEHRLRRAIDGGHLVALHQPVIQLSDGAITGVETLVRIQDPDVGLLPPVAFIDVAEDTGLIVEVDAWIVEHAVGQFAQWQAAGLPTQHIAVNVSPRSLEEARFADVLGCALSRHGVEGMRVHVELTERSLLNSTAAAQRTLDALREMGVRVGIDDFGTGYSALAYLQRFALDFMKIDRSFVARLGTSVRDDAVVAAIIDLAHAHELEVIAEGVEEPGQLARLRSMGCDAAQGYLMGRPMRPEDVEALCRAGHTW